MAEKLGPLPLYGWAGIGAIGVAGFMYEKKKKAAAAAAAATQAAGTTNPAGLTPITTIPYSANISYGNGSAGGARHGATGATGPAGPAGPAGAAGTAGATGPAGAAGTTATVTSTVTSTAKANPFTGNPFGGAGTMPASTGTWTGTWTGTHPGGPYQPAHYSGGTQ